MNKQGGKARVLIYDIETSPIEGVTWGLYEQNVVWVDRDWHILTVSWKWLGDKQVHVLGLPDFKLYDKDPRDDKKLVEKLWDLFNEADVVIAHNGDQFDQKKSQARMLIHGFDPPSPYLQIDTKKAAKRYFAFTSNKLDDLGEYLGVGRKYETGGKYLWKSCIEGDLKAWARMKKYNRQDVLLLERIYLKLRPWIQNHPAMNILTDRPLACPKCGGGPLHKRGTRKTTKTTTVQRLQCQNCGGWSQERKSVRQSVEYVN